MYSPVSVHLHTTSLLLCLSPSALFSLWCVFLPGLVTVLYTILFPMSVLVWILVWFSCILDFWILCFCFMHPLFVDQKFLNSLYPYPYASHLLHLGPLLKPHIMLCASLHVDKYLLENLFALPEISNIKTHKTQQQHDTYHKRSIDTDQP